MGRQRGPMTQRAWCMPPFCTLCDKSYSPPHFLLQPGADRGQGAARRGCAGQCLNNGTTALSGGRFAWSMRIPVLQLKQYTAGLQFGTGTVLRVKKGMGQAQCKWQTGN